MADLFRRFREGDGRNADDIGAVAPEEDSRQEDPSELTRTVKSYLGERSGDVHDRAKDDVSPPREVVTRSREPETAAQLGEHISAVIASAQRAAEEMRAEAADEAEQLRADARDEARSIVAEATREAEQVRAAAESYSTNVRKDADAYAGERRSEAQAYSSRLRAEAEETLRSARETAEQEAKVIEQEAVRRRQVLSSEAQRFEERLTSLYSVFRGITTQLEALLPDQRSTGDDRDEGDAALDESLKSDAARHAPRRSTRSSRP